MAWSRRYGRRRSYRRYRSRRWSSRSRPSRRYRRYGKRSGTRSSLVKLTWQTPVNMQTPTGVRPLSFSPTQLPGFMDYFNVYSQFRIVKGNLKVHLDTAPVQPVTGQDPPTQVLTNQQWTFLKVASRPFIEDQAQENARLLADGSFEGGISNQVFDVADLQEPIVQLRQSKWQKQYYPSDVRNVLSFNFRPYTLSWSGMPLLGPTPSSTADRRVLTSQSYLRAMRPGSWMPMSFTGVSQLAASGTTLQSRGSVVFYGPYLARLLANQGDGQVLTEWNPVCTMTLYVQFKGQR